MTPNAFNTLPDFGSLEPSNIKTTLLGLLNRNRNEVKSLLKQKDFTWENLIIPLDKINDDISRFWSPIGHMNSVMNTDELRDAYDSCLEELSIYSTEMGQNAGLYEAIKSVLEKAKNKKLNATQIKILEDEVDGFKLSGVALPEKEKARYKEIKQKLSALTSKFEQNVLDATKAWSLHITDKNELAGLPDYAVSMAEAAAAQADKKGFMLNLQMPCYIAVMTYADNRELRQKMYTAFSTRASNQKNNKAEFNNDDVIAEILSLRQEAAKLLGFENYAERSIYTKMAKDTKTVQSFLLDLASKAKASAQKDLKELHEYAAKSLQGETLQPWDTAYYSEKLSIELYELSQEALKPYFPEHEVINGLFTIVNRLYGVTIKVSDEQSTYHKDVKFYDVYNQQDEKIAGFYFDLYARENKRGGAWMDVCLSRFKLSDALQLPVAYMTCNLTPPLDGKPALFTHDEVITLFHEFGHGLHHMLTEVDYPAVSGIAGVEWDAVELPSQFMENWAWEREALNLFAKHYETGESLPDDMYTKMIAGKNFQAAMQLLRQVEFSLFDLAIHANPKIESAKQVQETLDAVRNEVAVIKPPEWNRFQNGFSHIFAGGYAAGYYSYKWAEVLSADAFELFKEEGVFSEKAGKQFLQNILQKGGSEKAMELFIKFRGREPSIDALLKDTGLAA